jgi:hypothetical protein
VYSRSAKNVNGEFSGALKLQTEAQLPFEEREERFNYVKQLRERRRGSV